MRSLAKLCIAGSCCVLATASALGIAKPQGLDTPGSVAADPARGASGAPPAKSRQGNPLWDIPLEQLSATRDRPIFSPSRRAPAPAAETPAVATAPAVPEPTPPERPQLSLVGTVMNGVDGVAIFLDQSSKTPLRLRIGSDYQGWTLRQVEARSATLQNGQDVAVFSFAPPSSQPTSQPTSSAGASIAQMPATPTAPPLAQAGPPYLSPESSMLRMPARHRSARRQL